MTFDPAIYQERTYPSPPCWALVADVYESERGQGVAAYRTITSNVRAIAEKFRIALHKDAHGFEQIDEPVDLCVVLLGKRTKMGPHHCGIYYDGKVLHALDSGTLLQDLVTIRDEYQLVEFWARPT